MAYAFDLASLFQSLPNTGFAPLPGASLRQIVVHLLWGLLLAAASWHAGAWLPRRRRLGFVALVGAWAVLPGPISPAYWLEMAFAAPSWTSALVCSLWLLRQMQPPPIIRTSWAAGGQAGIGSLWAVVGIALGWVLALDTFAALPFGESVYAWGFTPWATLSMMVVGAGAWVVRPRWTNALPLLALALYVSTRMPSGNVWDAVIDPLLWLYMHGVVALRVGRRLRGSSQG